MNMKKILMFAILIFALGAFAARPSGDTSHHATLETLSPLAMMQASPELPTGTYDAY